MEVLSRLLSGLGKHLIDRQRHESQARWKRAQRIVEMDFTGPEGTGLV